MSFLNYSNPAMANQLPAINAGNNNFAAAVNSNNFAAMNNSNSTSTATTSHAATSYSNQPNYSNYATHAAALNYHNPLTANLPAISAANNYNLYAQAAIMNGNYSNTTQQGAANYANSNYPTAYAAAHPYTATATANTATATNKAASRIASVSNSAKLTKTIPLQTFLRNETTNLNSLEGDQGSQQQHLTPRDILLHKKHSILRKTTVAYGIVELLKHAKTKPRTPVDPFQSGMHSGLRAAAERARECTVENFTVTIDTSSAIGSAGNDGSMKPSASSASSKSSSGGKPSWNNILSVSMISPPITASIFEPSFLSGFDVIEDGAGDGAGDGSGGNNGKEGTGSEGADRSSSRLGMYLEVEIEGKIVSDISYPTLDGSSGGTSATRKSSPGDEDDMHSLGMLLYELYLGKPPTANMDAASQGAATAQEYGQAVASPQQQQQLIGTLSNQAAAAQHSTSGHDSLERSLMSLSGGYGQQQEEQPPPSENGSSQGEPARKKSKSTVRYDKRKGKSTEHSLFDCHVLHHSKTVKR